MHVYPNHCVLSEREKYNRALEITKYSNFSSTVIKKKALLPPHPFKSHCSMSQRYSIIPYKEYLLSFLHYYYIICYLYYYRTSSTRGPQLRLTAPLCSPLWRHMAQKHHEQLCISTDKGVWKKGMIGICIAWVEKWRQTEEKEKIPKNFIIISHKVGSVYCLQAGLCGFHGQVYNAQGGILSTYQTKSRFWPPA